MEETKIEVFEEEKRDLMKLSDEQINKYNEEDIKIESKDSNRVECSVCSKKTKINSSLKRVIIYIYILLKIYAGFYLRLEMILITMC